MTKQAGPFPKTRIGQVFEHAGKMWRRGKGIYYVAHPAAPIIERAYRKRLKKRQQKRKDR